MKTFKIVINCVVSSLLVISLVLNILFLLGFTFTKDKNPETPTEYIQEVDKSDCEESTSSDTSSTTPSKQTEDTSTVDTSTEKLIYEDSNIKVLYCGIKEDTPELTYLFKIENLSSKTLNVTFDNLFINGQKVYISGLTCEKLLPNTSSISDFVFKETDPISKQDTNELIFNIKLMNAKSYLDLYTTEQITFNV